MNVNGIGPTPPQYTGPASIESESSLVIINNSDDDDKKNELTLLAYSVSISSQAYDIQNGASSLESSSHQGSEFNTYNASGKLVASASASFSGGAAGASGSSGGSGTSSGGGAGSGATGAG